MPDTLLSQVHVRNKLLLLVASLAACKLLSILQNWHLISMVVIPECIDDNLSLYRLDGVYHHCHCSLIQGFKALQRTVTCSGSNTGKHALKSQPLQDQRTISLHTSNTFMRLW